MRNRRGISGTRGGKPRVLVDTTFLLPALGIEVEEEAMRAIELFRMLDVYYLEAGLLEALWKTLKLVPLERLGRVELGVRAIRRTYRVLLPGARAFTLASEIYHRGHRDYIDALHYAAARTEGLPLLTIDRSFIAFLEASGYRVEGVVYTPRSLPGLLGDAAGRRG